ncbi:MAG: hypothetical protein PVH41_16035 [Anaerolineae bacterium]|jgi:hypothetical protein
MSGEWLEIPDPSIDASEVRDRVRDRMGVRSAKSPSLRLDEDPEALVERLREQMIDSDPEDALPVSEQDCDIVPRNYVIDWRIPILGPVHAWVRRIINAEVRRYLALSLERQSYLNRQFLRVLDDLVVENERLRQRIEELRDAQE